jgi:hypothetical protein
MRKLTIGMAVHDDYDGLYFTIQAIRMYHKEVLDNIEFVIIDNNPDSAHGKHIRSLCDWIQEPCQYLPYVNKKSTSVRNKIFDLAETPYVLSLDCHVLLEAGSLKKLIDYYDAGLDMGNLLQGPLVYDNMSSISTHFDLKWSSCMWGTWETDQRGVDANAEPFEIPAQGCGLFSCRKDSWLRLNDKFEGFGGEEGYIHKKYKKAGKKTMCLPFLRWLHRFGRPNGVTYPNNMQQRYRNYMIGFSDLGLPHQEVTEHFLSHGALTKEIAESIKKELQIFD